MGGRARIRVLVALRARVRRVQRGAGAAHGGGGARVAGAEEGPTQGARAASAGAAGSGAVPRAARGGRGRAAGAQRLGAAGAARRARAGGGPDFAGHVRHPSPPDRNMIV